MAFTSEVNSRTTPVSGQIVAAGTQRVLSKGTTTDITVSQGGIQILSGGITKLTKVSAGGQQKISSGGTAVSTTIFREGKVFVYNGGVASGTVISAAYAIFAVEKGGNAVDTVISSGTMTLNASARATGTIISGGSQVVFGGAVADNTTICNGGKQEIYLGAQVTNLKISEGGVAKMNAGAIVSGATVYTGGSQMLHATASALNTRISGGSQLLLASAYASNTVITDGGTQIVASQSIADATTVSNGSLQINKSAIARGAVMISGGSAVVNSGGILSGAQLSMGGALVLNDGGVATNITRQSGGVMILSTDGTTLDGKDANGGSFKIVSGAASGLVIENGGLLTIASGTKAISTSIRAGGTVVCLGSAQTLALYSGGVAELSSGSVLNGLTVSGGAFSASTQTAISNGSSLRQGNSSFSVNAGVAKNLFLDNGSIFKVFSGHIASTTLVQNGLLIGENGAAFQDLSLQGGNVELNGTVTLTGCVVASAATISGNGILDMSKNNVNNSVRLLGNCDLTNTTIVLGGTMLTVQGENNLLGKLVTSGGALVFDLTTFAAEQAPMVANLNAAGECAITLLLPTTLGEGQYTFAAGAFDFNRSITVKSAQTTYGTLSISSDLAYGDLLFSLEVNFNGELSLTITSIADTSVPTGHLNASGMPSWLTIVDNQTSVCYFNGETTTQVSCGSLPSANTKLLTIGNLTGSTSDQAIFFDYEASRLFGWNFDSTGNKMNEITFAKPSADASWRFIGCGSLYSTTRDQLLFLKDNQTLGYYSVSTGTTAKWQEIGTLPDGIDPNYQVIGVGKFDGSATDSIVWQNRKTGVVGLWNFSGTRSFSWQLIGNSHGNLERELIAVGDFNGDGGADLLWTDRNRGETVIEVFHADGNGAFNSMNILCDRGSLSGAMDFFGIADLNSDGIDDILWCDSESGDVSGWLLDRYGRRTETIAVLP